MAQDPTLEGILIINNKIQSKNKSILSSTKLTLMRPWHSRKKNTEFQLHVTEFKSNKPRSRSWKHRRLKRKQVIIEFSVHRIRHFKSWEARTKKTPISERDHKIIMHAGSENILYDILLFTLIHQTESETKSRKQKPALLQNIKI